MMLSPDIDRNVRHSPTPQDMPQRKPRHTWTPPSDVVKAAAPDFVPLTPSPDNSKARRARRNGYHPMEETS